VSEGLQVELVPSDRQSSLYSGSLFRAKYGFLFPLVLPRTRSKEYDMVEVQPGDDLNAVVHRHYNGSLTQAVRDAALANDKARRKKVDKNRSAEMDGWVDGAGYGINYVAGEGVSPKRHEYLGPAPMVSGYKNLRTTSQDVQILWYDNFLQDRWCEKESWDVDVEITVNSKGDAEWTVVQT